MKYSIQSAITATRLCDGKRNEAENKRNFTSTASYKAVITGFLSLFLIASTCVRVKAQLTVFTDNFNRSSFTSGSTGGTPATTYNFTLGGTSTINTTSDAGTYYATINSGSTANKSLFYAPMNVYSSPFNLTLHSNPGLITWTFNMRTSSAVTTSTPTSGAVSGGIDLCGSGANNIYNGAPQGYGVVFNSGATGGVNLIRFSGGMNASTTLITETTTMASKTDYYSVRVTYNPSTNQWSLYTRDDGASAFANPATGVTTQQGSTITDATYTTTPAMVNFGALYCFTAGTGKTMSVANYTVSLATCAGTPAPGNTVGTPSNVCTGNTSTLSLQNPTTGIGVTYQWSSAPNSGGLPGSYTAITGATSSTYTPTISATTWYECNVGCSYSSSSTTANQLEVNALAVPTAISSPSSFCNGQTATVSDVTTGGAWSSASTLIATVGPATGIVGGVSVGATTITYTASDGCIATSSAVVNPSPTAVIITPATSYSVCPGVLTTVTAAANAPTPTVVLSNNFNATPNGLVGQVGGTWTTNNTGTSPSFPTSYLWNVVPSGTYIGVTGDGTPYAAAYPDPEEYLMVSQLITPSFSTTGYTSGTLTFNQYLLSEPFSSSSGFAEGDYNVEIDYSLNGGSSWTLLPSANYLGDDLESSTTWTAGTLATVPLPTAILNQSSVMLRWYYKSYYGFFWIIDNVSIQCLPSPLPPSAFAWSGPSGISCSSGCATTALSPVAAGANIYTATATYGGCSTTGTVNINVIETAPTVTAVATPNALCLGKTLTVNATPAGGSGSYTSYSWTGPGSFTAATQSATRASIAAGGAGVYSVTVTDNLGCTSLSPGTTASVTVESLPTITATAVPTAICSGYTLTLNATPAGGSGTYTSFAWSGPGSFAASTQNAINPGMSTGGTGIYSVTVTDNNGCTSIAGTTASVTLNSLPTISATATPTALCAGATLTLTATPAGGSGTYSSYSWNGPPSFSASTQNTTAAGITLGGSGVYNVTVTDNNGCTSAAGTTSAVTVHTLPTIAATATPTAICATATLTLNAAPAGGGGAYLSFAWHGPGSFSASTQNTASPGITATGAGIYSVTVTDINGCTSAPGGFTSSVTVNPLPSITAAATPTAICAGNTLTLNATPSGGSGTYSSFTWSGPGGFSASAQNTTNPGMSATGVGIYSISVTDNNGCRSAAVGTTASVSLYTLPVITATATPTAICAGSNLVLNSTPTSGSGTYSSFSWNGPGGFIASTQNTTNTVITAAGAGIYSVSVTDNNGCVSNPVAVTSAVTVNALPNVTSFSVPAATALCMGGTSTVTVNSSSLASATFTVTYNLSGANPVTAHTAPLVMAAGTGTFIIPSTDLTNTGLTIVTISSLTNVLGCISSLSSGNSIGFIVNPLPQIINGSPSVCLLSVTTLSDTTTPGAWSSSNTAVATIGSSTGFLTGATIGTAIITYTLPTGCYTTTLENVNPIPNVYNVTGGGSFCSSNPTIHIGLNGSDLGASYQIYVSGIATGGLITGTGIAMDFGLQTVSGIYTVIANPSATCARAMAGSATVINNPSPNLFTVTGGGSFCAGGSGVLVGMNYGQSSMSYQLYSGSATAGSAFIGTGYPFNFGLEPAGTYTVVATNPANSCVTNMAGSAIVTANPLPPVISGIASVCVGLTTALNDGATGGSWSSSNTALATVGLSSGVVSGLSSGLPSVTYTLPTGCITSSQVTVNTTPPAPGGVVSNVCFGSTITLSDAISGGTWSSGGTSVATIGSLTGVVTGGLAAGTANITYTLPAGCNNASTITVNSLPAIKNVTGGGQYCSGGTGVHVGLNGSNAGISYQLFNGVTASGSAIAGTGSALDFGARTAAGTYTVVATNTITGCSSNMSGIAAIAINPLPAAFTVSGGGSYCAGLPGVDISLGGSVPGLSYQLFDASTPIGGAVPGTGASYDFGLQTAAGTYGVMATNPSTGCYSVMSGSPIVTVLPAPTAYAVTSAGSYCSGSSGAHILLSSSATGISYQVFNGVTSASGLVSGTGGSIDFGAFTAGTYTVTGTNTTTSCTSSMSGSVTITINPLPAPFSVTGGGGYCSGSSSASSVGLSGSAGGTSYQLYAATSPVGPSVAGTGGTLNFGIQSTPGNYTVIATITATGCTTTMPGSAAIVVYPLPTVFSMTGGGSYCTGSTSTVHAGLNGSATGVSYQLYNSGGIVPGSVIAGTGSALDFGALAAGSYTAVATSSTSCISSMSGSASIIANPLPAVFAVSITPGSNYCAGSAAPHILLSGSVTGVVYQLVSGGGTVGAVSGTGSSLDFGPQPASGTYTAMATTSATGCTSTMAGSATVITNLLPTVYSVTGGGSYCAGGTGKVVGLSGSTSGISYQLYIGGIATGTAVSGTGLAFNFPLQTAAGSYTIAATNTTTTCTSNMTGSVSISTTPLPVVYNVTGGGAYCAGTTTGVHIGLSSSDAGLSYQLYSGGTTAIGSAVAGTGSAIDFGAQTTTGTYTVIAMNTTTLCTSNMFGSAVVSTVSNPTAYAVSASGSYCSGGTGLPVTLGNSDVGVSYQLLRGGVTAGSPVAGTGSLLNFGNQTVAGNYTVFATNGTGCSSNMTGVDAISINPLPAVFTVTSTGTVYCAGDTGVHIGLNSSVSGFSYQLYNGGIISGGALAGTGSALDFGRATAGVYTIVATNGTTFCPNNMSGMIVVTANPLPAQFAVTGGGNYCAGGTGSDVGVANSVTGISYQLYAGSLPTGVAVAGTGRALDFGLQTAAGTYTVKGTNTLTGCTQTMTGTAIVGISTLPALHNVSGGGNYCIGGTGVDVYIDGSNTGISYQLYNGTTLVGAAMAGTGSAVHFGLQTAAGAYTVVATGGTTCTVNMTGSVTVGISPLPVVYTVTGGGNYCPSGTGVHIGLSGSDAGVQYQLFIGISPVDTPFTGTGSAIDFGLQTSTGAYTVVATNRTTSCINNMSGIVSIGFNPLPTAYNVTGGGNYCSGGTGMAIGIDGSDAGVGYQLYQGITPVSVPFAGTGFPINFGLQTAAGTYTVIATNTTTTCNNTMTGSAAITVNPLPDTFSVSGGGSYCMEAGGVAVGLRSSVSDVSYQLYEGGIASGLPVIGTGAAISFGMETGAGTYTVVATSGFGCTKSMPGSALVVVNPLPTSYSVTGGGNYCPSGTAMHIGLSHSAPGVSYQLYNGVVPTGIIAAGSGSAIDFGSITTPGIYYVQATNTTTSCTSNMSGSATIGINPLPTAYTVSASANQYCTGSSGVNILLSGSATETNYQLYFGTVASGTAVAGTGIPLNFGIHTAGTYTVIATSATTGCVNNMAGSAAVVVNSLPVAYPVAGGGNYCPGGSGVHVGLTGTTAGNRYQLYRGVYTAGSTVIGTGFAVDFGLQTAAGIYNVVATDTLTGCSSNMTGSAAVDFYTLPAVYTVTGGGNYCVSGTGVPVELSGSSLGIAYQLYNGTTAVGAPVTGTGTLLNFGLQTTSGAYTAVATNSASGCTSNMAGSPIVNTYSLPIAYAISGGGNYCAGGPGVDIGLGNSATSVNYQLYNGSVPTGVYLPGTGLPLDFGFHTAAGTYTLVATDGTTGCSSHMSGSATIGINPQPTAYNVTGGGNYCVSGTGVHVGLSNSQGGITYQLFNGVAPSGLPVSGTTTSVDFGLVTSAGTYSVVATNPVTGCAANMTDTAVVTLSTPVTPSVTLSIPGVDTFCAGTSVTVNSSVINGGTTPSYSWTVNGAAVTDASASLTYAPEPGDVVGVTMTSSATCATPAIASFSTPLIVLPHGMPTISISSGNGDTVCKGTSVTFTQASSLGGPTPALSWMVNGTAASSTPSYTYTPLDGDLVACVLTSDYQCRLATSVYSNQLNMVVDVSVTPVVTVIASPGTSLSQGQILSLTATISNAVIAPSFQWYLNGELIDGAVSPDYSTSTYSNLDSFSCIVTSGGGCSGLKGSASAVIHLANEGVKQVITSGSDIRIMPNPNNGLFTIKGSLGTTNDEQVSVEILDMFGQVIYKDNVIAHDGSIDQKIQLGNTLANGMYILNLRSESANDVFHVVIEQ